MAGIRYSLAHVGIGPVILLALATSTLVRSLADLMPGMSDLVYGRGVEGLAILMASFGIGALIGALWIANRNRIEGTTAIMVIGAIVSALATAVFAMVAVFEIAVVLMVLIGFTGAMWQNASQILIQNAVEGAMRARVMSLYFFNYGSAPALGAMLIGGLSAFVDLPTAISIGVMCVLPVLIWIALRRGQIRNAMEYPNSKQPT